VCGVYTRQVGMFTGQGPTVYQTGLNVTGQVGLYTGHGLTVFTGQV